MEFLSPNYVNTSTMLAVDSNTAGSSFLFDRRPQRKYFSAGFNDDLTTTSIRVSFPNTVTIDHIILQNINWKKFTIWTGATATTFALTTTAGTIASAWTANAGTNLYLVLASTTAMTSMSIDVYSTQTANEEKAVGQLYVGSRLYQFAKNPDIGGFDPVVHPKHIEHEMSDGGTIVYRIREKMYYTLSVKYDTDFSTLKTNVYDLNSEIYFTPFPTCTSWNGDAYEVQWVGGFFAGKKPSQNYVQTGYDLKIKLEETPA